MTIINFAISKPLEDQVNEAIEQYGFASKAEFFRFSAMDFIKKEKTRTNKEEGWEVIADFTKIKKGGVNIDEVLKRL